MSTCKHLQSWNQSALEPTKEGEQLMSYERKTFMNIRTNLLDGFRVIFYSITRISHATIFVSLAFVASLTCIIPLSNAQSEVVIEVNNTPSGDDDYFCWSPIPARVRVNADQSDPASITLRSESRDNGGRVGFSHNLGISVSSEVYSSLTELEITLPEDGSWVDFFVSGIKASVDGKDVSIVAFDRVSGARLDEVRVMVRVRKNANHLQNPERDRFLHALANLNGMNGINQESGHAEAYEKYVHAHGEAFTFGIHGGEENYPLFLAWHRAFLLSIERELQEIDPRVTIPYWRFDEHSDNIFVEDFMGRVLTTDAIRRFQVKFNATNPLYGWKVREGSFSDEAGPLTRIRNPNRSLHDYPDVNQYFVAFDELFIDTSAESYGGRRGANARIETGHHNAAHAAGGGVLNSFRSPSDPVFFLLHANVDRVWAKWQEQFSRFDPASAESYPLQGRYGGQPTGQPYLKGSYALDAMWPWSLDDGSDTPLDPGDDWPGTGFEFPLPFSELGPKSAPTPASMIDFMNTMGTGRSHGVCYDDIAFAGGSD